MPLVQFICPDGERLAVIECLGHCRMARRCLSLPTLRECANDRPWTGVPSVTQLLNGTMLEFLRLTTPFAIKPESKAFALLGTGHHAQLEDMAFGLDAEFAVEGAGWVGHPDFLEAHEDGTYTLWDYKTWGSYRVARALGLTSELVDDPKGNVYSRSGTWGRAGTVKQVKLWSPNPLLADLEDVSLQLNAYRLGIEVKVPVGSMRLQVTVRDGGLAMAKERGIAQLVYTIDIPRLDDDEVRAYFQDKAENLNTAMAEGTWALPCSTSERWDNERCKGYCDVWFACEHGKEIHEGLH